MRKKDARPMERHHRLPRSRGGHHTSRGKRDNIILVERNLHRAWHALFDGPDALAEAIAFFLYMREYPGITEEVQQHIDNCLNWFRSELAAQSRPN